MRVIRLAFEFRQAFAQGRRRRPGLLPPLRPQRSRRARVHPAAMYELIDEHRSVRQDLHRSSSCTAATSRPTRRSRARSRLPRPARPRVRGDARRSGLDAASSDLDLGDATARSARRSSVDDRGAARGARRSRRRAHHLARRLPRSTRSSSVSCRPGAEFDGDDDRLGARRGARVRLARRSRARRCASPARTPGAARSASATACSSTSDSEREYVPLAHLADDQAPFMLYDTVLSEYAALGFEYGYSVAIPTRSCAGRRSSATSPTARRSSSTSSSSPPPTSGASAAASSLLLPHGFEGQGPEHSSARIERFLTLCAEDNLRVVYPSTAAQYFHALRRQAVASRADAARVLHAEALPAHAADALAGRRRSPTAAFHVRARRPERRRSTPRR